MSEEQQQLDLGPHKLPQPTATITIGISASGKTTWAEEEAKKINAKIICRDDIRRALFKFGKWSDYKFTKAKEKRVSEVVRQLIFDCSITGQSIIIADTNLNPGHLANLKDTLQELGFKIETEFFPIDYEEAVKRDLGRIYSVGSQVIYRQYKQWLKIIERKTYKADESLPKAIIVDVDGTVARKSPDRGFFDWSKVGKDIPRDLIINMVQWFREYPHNYKIVVLSGRDSICRQETYSWLLSNGVYCDQLFMREEGDKRKDTIIKEELFWKYVAPNCNVVGVIDDRPCMIRLWYELGIENVISVANPWEEF